MKALYLISHGHTARGALQTGLLRLLADRGVDVVVVCKPGAASKLEEVVHAEGAMLDIYSGKTGRWDAQRTIFRSFVHQDVRKNPALWEKHQRRLRNGSVIRRLVNRFYFALGNFIRRLGILRRVYVALEARLYQSREAFLLLRKHNPDIVISTRPVDSMEAEVLSAAGRMGIHKTMYILSWDNITSKGVFPVLADSYLTWGDVMERELKEYYRVREDQLYTTGVTHFDVHAGVRDLYGFDCEWVRRAGVDPKKPYMLFTMSSSYFAPNEIDVIEWLASKVSGNAFGDDMQLIVRPHMQNLDNSFSDHSWVHRLEALSSARVGVDWPSVDSDQLTWFMSHDEMGKLSHLLKGASVCLNSGSTISIEACIFDKPVILTMIDVVPQKDWTSVRRILKFKHIETFLSFDPADVVLSFEELEIAIRRALLNPRGRSENRKQVVAKECYKVDGLATERFVNNISHILGRVRSVEFRK